jgi:hypothetical protein
VPGASSCRADFKGIDGDWYVNFNAPFTLPTVAALGAQRDRRTCTFTDGGAPQPCTVLRVCSLATRAPAAGGLAPSLDDLVVFGTVNLTRLNDVVSAFLNAQCQTSGSCAPTPRSRRTSFSACDPDIFAATYRRRSALFTRRVRPNRLAAPIGQGSVVRFWPAFIGVLVLTACGGSDRVATPPRVTAVGPIYRAVSPLGEAGVFVAIYFTLMDAENSPTDLLVEVSRAGGAFATLGSAATGSLATGSDPIRGLTARREGSLHRLLWKTPADLGATEAVIFRLTPSEPEVPPPPPSFHALVGQPVLSASFHLASLGDEPR